MERHFAERISGGAGVGGVRKLGVGHRLKFPAKTATGRGLPTQLNRLSSNTIRSVRASSVLFVVDGVEKRPAELE